MIYLKTPNECMFINNYENQALGIFNSFCPFFPVPDLKGSGLGSHILNTKPQAEKLNEGYYFYGKNNIQIN